MQTLYLAQLLIPLALIAWIALAPPVSRVGFWLQAAGTAFALVALQRAGSWLFPPWWMPFVYGLLLVIAIVMGRKRVKRDAFLPRGPLPWTFAVLFGVLGLFSVNATLQVISGATVPAKPTADLVFPLRGGTFLIANGGNDLRINAHQESMMSSDPRFKPWRGKGYAVDIVAIGKFGFRAYGLLPEEPSAYRIFGMPVVAPCAGTVAVAVDGVADMIVPQFDRDNMAGNHVVLACEDVHVVMAHFRQGSVMVRAGDSVTVGEKLAEVGNSGGSNEPHLHIHAQRPGPVNAPMGGDLLPATFNGRFLVRG